MTWRVRIEIDVEADSPTEAALEAWNLLHAPDCMPWVCDVYAGMDTARDPVTIDLDEILNPEAEDLPVQP